MTSHKDEHHKAAADPKPDPKPATTKVKMQKGTDEVNHGTTKYPVQRDGTVELPPEAAAHVIRQGGAEDLTPKPDAPESMVDVRHVSDPDAVLSWGGEIYKPGGDGKLSVPVASLADIAPHGFLPC